MRAILTLQIPSEDLKKGRIPAASSDFDLIKLVSVCLLAKREKELAEHDGDLFEKELARLQLEQLRARLSFALDLDMPQ